MSLLENVTDAVSVGQVPAGLDVSSYGDDPVLSAAEQSWNPMELADVSAALDLMGPSGPPDLFYALLTGYSAYYPEYEQYLLRQAVYLASIGRANSRDGQQLLGFLNDAIAANAETVLVVPLLLAANLMSPTGQSVSAAVCTLATFEGSPGYPFPEYLVAAAIKQHLQPPTVPAVYQAAQHTDIAMMSMQHGGRVMSEMRANPEIAPPPGLTEAQKHAWFEERYEQMPPAARGAIVRSYVASAHPRSNPSKGRKKSRKSSRRRR